MSSWRNEKIEENRIYILYALWKVEMEDVTLLNNTTLCKNATRNDVVVGKGAMHKELFVA